MRIVAWNCNGGYHRKAAALMRLAPDIAVVSECAQIHLLRERGLTGLDHENCVWVGTNPNKGLAVFGFNGWQVRLDACWQANLHHIAPVTVTGPASLALLAIWAQNASGGVTRKHQLGPLRRALSRYQRFLVQAPAILAGDFNNNPFWDRPGWRMNHMAMVGKARRLGLESAYHRVTGEGEGAEIQPTHYWRDRKKDGPTYHIDYIFAPAALLDGAGLSVGTFEDWCGNGLSDHVPVTLDLPIPLDRA